jgi:hypothetical protein
VWETRVTSGEGKLIALVIQTQIVLPPASPANELREEPTPTG